ncbi:hypothetical protein HMPREF1569_2433 [Klebsiella oxytoca OK-1]|nr:hypothetical protein HMPREF1569_2433 [Klebsiella oxytoca OK-1]
MAKKNSSPEVSSYFCAKKCGFSRQCRDYLNACHQPIAG